MKKETKKDLKKVADAVTEKPIEVTISRRGKISFFEKLAIKMGLSYREVKFQLKRPSIGLNYSISGLQMELEEVEYDPDKSNDWANLMRIQNTYKMAEIIATYIHGDFEREAPDSLVRFILNNVDDEELESLVEMVREACEIKSFITSIAMIRSLDVLSPALASPQDTGEIIAPGGSSEGP